MDMMASPSSKVNSQGSLLESECTQSEGFSKRLTVFITVPCLRRNAQIHTAMFKLRTLPALTSVRLTFTSWQVHDLSLW